MHTEVFNTKLEAMKRERELKSGRGRKFIWELIRSGSGVPIAIGKSAGSYPPAGGRGFNSPRATSKHQKAADQLLSFFRAIC